ncbi:putative O-methylsterigmatocystin oxidoreductase [Xylaria telfairii]|nr:putative O-methylsterigmatocystin oxidoreductase [Xylaria telfairii]
MDGILVLYERYRLLSLPLLLTVIIAALAWRRRDRRCDAIPGPPGYPLIGVGFQLPRRAPVLFRKWAAEYGDIFKIRVGWYDWVVINTPEAVREILEKQAAVTSSKAPSPMSHGTVTRGNRMPTMPYGPEWRALRTLVHQITAVPRTTALIPSQEFEAKQLVFDLATDNNNQRNFYQHMRRYAISIIMTNTFGTRIKSWDHADAKNALKSQIILRRTSHFIVDDLPPLQYLPKWLQPGHRDAIEAAKEVADIKMDLWHRLEKQVEDGKAPHCFAREVYESRKAWYAKGLTEEQLAWLTGGLVEAGFETTATALNSLVLQLAANIRVQDAAHAELAQVVGPNRLPTFADLANLPYIRACVKEALRINPMLAPGIRHFTDTNVVYKNYVIPKGTVLLANTAFLHFDPKRFESPFEFKPERYLGHQLYSSEYAAMSDPYQRDHFTFSTGRRTCPGARLAENSLGIALAAILWAFDIRPPVVDGTEAAIDLSENAYLDGLFTIPKPFAARFLPRDDAALRVVRDTWDTAMKQGYELRGVRVDIDGVVEKAY